MACSAATNWKFEVREGEIITCPWHGIEFDIATARALLPRLRVRTYPVAVEDGQVKVTV